jgi:hypothetical protein
MRRSTSSTVEWGIRWVHYQMDQMASGGVVVWVACLLTRACAQAAVGPVYERVHASVEYGALRHLLAAGWYSTVALSAVFNYRRGLLSVVVSS